MLVGNLEECMRCLNGEAEVEKYQRSVGHFEHIGKRFELRRLGQTPPLLMAAYGCFRGARHRAKILLGEPVLLPEALQCLGEPSLLPRLNRLKVAFSFPAAKGKLHGVEVGSELVLLLFVLISREGTVFERTVHLWLSAKERAHISIGWLKDREPLV